MKNEAKQTQTQLQTHSRTASGFDSQEGAAADPASLPTTRRYKELFVVEDRPNGRGAYWTKVGVAFETKNGHWSLKLNAIPVVAGGRIIMMDPKPRDAANENRDDDRRVAA